MTIVLNARQFIILFHIKTVLWHEIEDSQDFTEVSHLPQISPTLTPQFPPAFAFPVPKISVLRALGFNTVNAEQRGR